MATKTTRRGTKHSGWFDRCVSGVSQSGSAVDPEAVCGAVLKRKLASNPHLSQIAYLNDMGEYEREGPIFNTKEEAFTEAKSMQASGQNVQVVWKDSRTGVYHDKKFMARKGNPVEPQMTDLAYRMGKEWGSKDRGLLRRDRTSFLRLFSNNLLEDLRTRGLIKGRLAAEDRESLLTAFQDGYRATYEVGRQSNPEGASESMYSSFHGVPSTETLEYEQDLHYHGNLAALGELVELKVDLLDGNKAVLTFDVSDDQQSSNPQKWVLPKRQGKKNYEDVGYMPYVLEHDIGFGGEKRYRVVRYENGSFTVMSRELADTHYDSSSRKSAIDAIKYLAQNAGQKVNPTNNPFWPFSSFTKSTIYHVGSGRKYGVVGTHKGYSIYKHGDKSDPYFMVPKLDGESRLDSLSDAKKFIDSWVSAQKNPSDDSDYSGFGKYAYSVYWGVGSAKWPMANGYYSTRKEAEERAKLERRKSGSQFKYAVKKVEHRTNPKGKRHTGPFTESGKLIGKFTKSASGPLDQFMDTAGKVGGYVDSQIGRVLNPNTDFSLYHIAKETDDEFQRALEKEYGKRAGDMRYQSAKHPAHIKALAKKKHAADELWLKEMRKKNPQVPSASSVLLTSNEKGTQLYLIGGDQSLDLSSLNITGPAAEKEHVTIGDVTHIVYRTKKDFDNMAETDYIHKFSEDSDGPLPELIYDRLNKRLSLVGGVYFIKQPLVGTSDGIED